MSRFRGERASDALDLQQLLSEYCFELDLTGGLQAHRFFTADGRLEVGKMSLKGHEAMKVFYQDLVDQAKTSGTERTTRHLWSNLRISFEDENRAFVDFIMQNFSAIGHHRFSVLPVRRLFPIAGLTVGGRVAGSGGLPRSPARRSSWVTIRYRTRH